MTAQRTKIALTGLQWTLGLVILIEAILFLLPNAAHAFASTHMPNIIRIVLGWGEIAGCILMLLTPAGTEPPGARPVTVGQYHAWLVPAGNGAALVFRDATPGQDLMIGESRLSEPQFLRLVATGLS